jgi:hypothetical protein
LENAGAKNSAGHSLTPGVIAGPARARVRHRVSMIVQLRKLVFSAPQSQIHHINTFHFIFRLTFMFVFCLHAP